MNMYDGFPRCVRGDRVDKCIHMVYINIVNIMEVNMKGRDVILGLLMQKSMSGYDIKQIFESVFSYFFDASYGTIYPTLNHMEKDGYIEKDTVLQEGKPNKNVYSITEKGKELFFDYLDSPIEPDVCRSDFLMRMYFGNYSNEDKITDWIKGAMDQSKRTIEQLEANYENWAPCMNSSQKICFEIGISSLKAKFEILHKHYQALKRN
jgi:DNA-binding PadR family transcriptional regulator